MIGGGCCLFVGSAILQATAAFWTTKSLEISCFSGLEIMGLDDPLGTTSLFQRLAPLIGAGFLLVCLQAWKLGVRHCQSTGT